eukprot:UN14014
MMIGFLALIWNSCFIFISSGQLEGAHDAAETFCWFFWISNTVLIAELIHWRGVVFELGPEGLDDSVYGQYGQQNDDSQFNNDVNPGDYIPQNTDYGQQQPSCPKFVSFNLFN